MQVIGFNLTKIIAEKEANFKRSTVTTQIEFTKVEKENIELLKDAEAEKITFKYEIQFNDEQNEEDKQGEVTFEGVLVISTTKEQAKEFQESWKKKQVPKEAIVSLYNIIIRKCSIKALQLEDDLNLPAHIPFPQVRPKDK
jgi:ribosomal protein L11